MKKSRYAEEQIAYALKQAEPGMHVAEVRRKMETSDATFFQLADEVRRPVTV